MILILSIQCLIVITLLRLGRNGLENALPAWCFVLTLMPLESRLVLRGLCDVNTMRVSLVTMLFLFLTRKKRTNLAPLPLKKWMFLHVFWVLCSTAYSLSVATSIKQLISQVLEYYLMYFLIVRTITEVRTIHRILYAMFLALSLCCVFSLFEVYGSWSILRIFPANLWITYDGGHDPLYIEWGRGLRARSTFPHPILFGDALAMMLPITLYLVSFWRERRQRLLLWVGFLLMAWALYKTSSRGPWMACAMCCALLFFFIKSKVRRYLVTFAVVTLAVALARPGIWDTIAGLYTSSTDASSPVGASYLYRHTLSETIKDVVRQDTGRMAFGYGLGTFREKGLNITFLGETHRWYTCDDNWGLFLYEMGYGGLIIISILLFTPLCMAWRDYRRLPRPDNALSGVLFIVLCGFYFLLLSVAGYSWGQQGYMSWILISLIISHRRVIAGSKAETRRGAAKHAREVVAYGAHAA
jgi:hypothetical protein